MTALNKQVLRMRNYLDTALKSGVKLLHLSTDELKGLLDELEKEKGYASAYEGEKWHYHQLAESEGERANRAETKLEAAEQRIAELEANNVLAHEALLKARRKTVTLPTGYSVRPGHPINEAERGVMIPKDNGPWLSRHDVEHALRVAGIGVKGD